jgi:hypothetical protein
MGDATPHWAELPQLDVRDQASMSMAFRFPPLPTLAPQETAGGGGPRDFVVVRDEFCRTASIRKTSGSQTAGRGLFGTSGLWDRRPQHHADHDA